MPRSGTVMTAAGRARFENPVGQEAIRITFDDGEQMLVPPEQVRRQADGQYWLEMTRSELQDRRAAPDGGAPPAGREAQVVVPLAEEEVRVGKRTVHTGSVRVSKAVRVLDEAVDVALRREHVEVQREPVNQYVRAPEPARTDGDRVIIPVYEEVVVVEKRLLLKERLIVTRRVEETLHREPVQRRVEEAHVERRPGEAARSGLQS